MDLPAFRVHMCNFINFFKGEQAPRAKTHERWICELYLITLLQGKYLSQELGLLACSGKYPGDQMIG